MTSREGECLLRTRVTEICCAISDTLHAVEGHVEEVSGDGGVSGGED